MRKQNKFYNSIQPAFPTPLPSSLCLPLSLAKHETKTNSRHTIHWQIVYPRPQEQKKISQFFLQLFFFFFAMEK